MFGFGSAQLLGWLPMAMDLPAGTMVRGHDVELIADHILLPGPERFGALWLQSGDMDNVPGFIPNTEGLRGACT